MKILHVGVGNLGSGGVATYVRMVVAGQRARGHEIFLAELWPGPSYMDEVQQVLIGLDQLRALQDKFCPDATHLHSQIPDYSNLRGRCVLTAHEHSAHCPSGGRYLEARRQCCERDFGILNCLWGHYVDRCGSRHPSTFLRHYRLTQATLSFSGSWIAPSNYTANRLARRGVPQSQIHTVPNPQAPQESEPAKRLETGADPTIVFIGRLVPNKGCDILLESLASLPPTTKLCIVGEGPDRQALESTAERLGVKNRVTFTGWLSPEGVKEQLASARVVAVPSIWPEPFGLVALEAYAAGVPVVASATGGLQDLVEDGVTGALAAPGSPGALSAALFPFLRDSEMAHRAGLAGQEKARLRFGLDMHLDALERIYRAAEGEGQ